MKLLFFQDNPLEVFKSNKEIFTRLKQRKRGGSFILRRGTHKGF